MMNAALVTQVNEASEQENDVNAAISPTTIIQAGRLSVDKELKEGQLRGSW
jgi:hypothetical protein